MSEHGLVLVLTGPSGAGKTSVIRAVLADEPLLSFSVSHTTRTQRAGEREGEHYYFVTPEAFMGLRDAGAFVEWAQVHGHFYGTSFAEIERAVGNGRALLLDIDVQGADQLTLRLPAAEAASRGACGRSGAITTVSRRPSRSRMYDSSGGAA